MKQLFLFALFLPLSVFALQGYEVMPEFKLSLFFPTDKAVRNTFGQVGTDWGAEITTGPCAWPLRALIGVDYYSRKGRDEPTGEYARLTIVPIKLGVKGQTFLNEAWNVYGALGPTWHFVQLNPSSSDFSRRNTSTIGGFFRLGTQFFLCRNMVLDLFAEYLYAKVSDTQAQPFLGKNKFELSGVLLGAGLAYPF